MIKRIFCIALVAALSFGAAFAQKKSSKLKKSVFLIGAQNQSSKYGSLVDLKGKKVYKIADVPEQEDIDFMYAYGKSTKLVLMTPTSGNVRNYGKNYREKIGEGWYNKNNGRFVVIKDRKQAKKLYKSLKTKADLEDAYAFKAKEVKTLEDYKLTTHGPSKSVVDLQMGDVILFRSYDRKFYAVGMIKDYEEGFKGHIEIEFKVSE